MSSCISMIDKEEDNALHLIDLSIIDHSADQSILYSLIGERN